MAETKKNNPILEKIIASTFARHAGLSEEDYLKELEVENPKSEDQEVRYMRMVLIRSCANELLLLNKKLDLVNQTILVIKEGEEQDGRIED